MRKTVAVKYDEMLPAPFIVASGRGELALAIERIARDWGVEIIKQPELAESLIDLEPGAFIPEAFYKIIAEILIFVRDLKERK
jgi:flagellar biosynthesis protein